MPVESDQERAAMLSSEEHGVVARFFPAAGGSFDTDVLFDDPFLRADLGFSAVSSREYTITALESAVAGIVRDDQVEVPVAGKRFRIKETMPRQGVVVFELDEV